jgi:NAD(P)-dependent dehydrogenase (short-subunit alcohol dehydrogenase family)
VTPTNLRFDEQVAVITGAGGGLGKQYALLLASRGARVVVNDTGGSVTGGASNPEAADAAAEEIRQLGGEAVADSHSVTSPEGGNAIIDTALRTWGRVDILINNAGIVRDAPFEEMTADRLEPLLDVHLKGAFYVTRPAWKVMREQGYGRVLNTCSAAGILDANGMSKLRFCQNRVDRSHPRSGRRRRQPEHQRQCHRPDRLYADAGALY